MVSCQTGSVLARPPGCGVRFFCYAILDLIYLEHVFKNVVNMFERIICDVPLRV